MRKLPYEPLVLMERFTSKDPGPDDFLSGDELHFLTCWLIDEWTRSRECMQKAPCGCHKSPSGSGWCSAHGTLANGPFDTLRIQKGVNKDE